MKKTFGFTLSEILITLGIIGIIAAMTIPSLITTYQKKANVQRLKQMYSLLLQASTMYADENGLDLGGFDTNLTPKDFIEKYFSRYMKISHKCSPVMSCYKNKKPLAIDRKSTASLPQYMVSLINGTYLGANKNGYAGMVFFIDVNGEAPPNMSGRDIFYFFLVNVDAVNDSNDACTKTILNLKQTVNSGLYPGGYAACNMPFSVYDRETLLSTKLHRGCNPNVTNLSSPGGDACAAVIMKDNWKILKDYPW